jgi:hypothetical protein
MATRQRTGTERSQGARLAVAGLVLPTAIPSAVIALGQASLALCGLAAAVCAAYLLKSALGIDLMAGPSPLHDLLFPLLRR